MSEEVKNNDMDPIIPTVAKAVPEGFWKMLYADLGQPAVMCIGKSLGKAMDFCSIPFYAMGYWSDKFKLNLDHRLKEYGKKLEKIPEENQCEVDPQIGVPILDHLTYTTNDEIADLFTTLLANASNIETIDKAHPSFAHMISRLSVDEARIIRYLQTREDVTYCTFRAIIKEQDYESSFITVVDHATLLPFRLELTFPNNVRAYLSNLNSLGILKDNDSLYKTEDFEYEEICEKFDLDSCKEKHKAPEYKRVVIEKGFYEVTPLGRLFIDACIKD